MDQVVFLNIHKTQIQFRILKLSIYVGYIRYIVTEQVYKPYSCQDINEIQTSQLPFRHDSIATIFQVKLFLKYYMQHCAYSCPTYHPRH